MTKLYLNQHLTSHGERKWVCEVCNQKFLYKHHLPRHQLAVHGAVTYNIHGHNASTVYNTHADNASTVYSTHADNASTLYNTHTASTSSPASTALQDNEGENSLHGSQDDDDLPVEFEPIGT
jgi:hypothetical protein